MIHLFHIPTYKIDTADFSHLLHGKIVTEFEEKFADYVGAKYACSTNSCATGIFLTFQGPWKQKITTVEIPSIIPYVVPNILTNIPNIFIEFIDSIKWVGHSYILHEFENGNFKVIDSAQDVYYKQFEEEANPQDLMLYSFYPTKPIGSCDGGMIVSNDKEKIDWFKRATMYGSVPNKNSWDRQLEFAGWKAYMNSIQAYIALQNLNKLDDKRQRLAEVSSLYNHYLGYQNTSYHLYRINVKNNKKFLREMKNVGVSCGIHYEPCHLMKLYNQTRQNLPISEQEGETTISIPFHEKLTQQELEYIVEKVNEFQDKET